MSASTEPRVQPWWRRRLRAAAVVLAVLVLTGAAVWSGNEGNPAPGVASAQAAPSYGSGGPPTPRYVMRCWQHGRMLFEEALSQLPADAEQNVIRLQGADRAQSLYHLVDTRTAVCLVKPSLDRSGWPVLHLPGRN